MTEPAFLHKLKTIEREGGWFTPCPDLHASDGFAVSIWPDEQMDCYRFECLEASNGDICGHERELLRMLGLTGTDVALNGAAPAGETGGLTWQPLEDVDMRSIVFVDKPLFQASAFHLVAGRKGQGKGTLLAETAARVNRGELGAKRNVVWIGSEDSAAIDIKPRIVAAGGDPARVLIPKDGWIQLPRDYDAIRRAMSDFGDVGMLVVDPVGNHISGKNSDGDTDIRDAIGPLNPLADEYECMAFGVRHLSEKDCSRGVLAAILGASAWVQVPRAVLAVARDNEDPDISHIQCVAGNRLPAGTPGRMFRIEGVLLPGLENEVTRATWLGDSSKDVETMLGNSCWRQGAVPKDRCAQPDPRHPRERGRAGVRSLRRKDRKRDRTLRQDRP